MRPLQERFEKYLGTHGHNMRDMVNKGRGVSRSGTAHANAKLSTEQIIEMRRKAKLGITYEALGREFGVSGVCARSAVLGITYKDVQ